MIFAKVNRGRSFCFLWIFNESPTWVLLLQLLPPAAAQTGTAPGQDVGYSFEPEVSRNTATIFIAMVCLFFVFGLFSVYLRQCIQNRFRGGQRPSVAQGGNNGQLRRDTRGLDVEVIATFPTFAYSSVKMLKIGKGSLECAVCLNEFEGDETMRLLSKCSHVFHSNCIDIWLTSHSTCPVCRANLVPQPGDPTFTVPVMLNQYSGPDEPENRVPVQTIEAPDTSFTNPNEGNNQSRPPQSWSTGWRLSGIFTRSHSTGHLPIRRTENHERFTLRLPEEIRNQLVNSTLNRARSCVPMRRAESSRQGYRSGIRPGESHSTVNLVDQNERAEWWSFSAMTPLFGRKGSSESQSVGTNGDEDLGERSFARLRPDTDNKV